MTLVACVFLIVFIASLLAYKRAETKRAQAQEARLEAEKRRNREAKKFNELRQKISRRIDEAESALKAAATIGGVEYQRGRVKFQEQVLFDRGEARLKKRGRTLVRTKLADAVAQAMKKPGHRILIAGHTDSVPINSTEFPSNWELSTRRATNVLREVLDSRPSIERDRIFAAGFAATRSLPGIEPTAAENRRVEVMVRPEVSDLLLDSANSGSEVGRQETGGTDE
jgi:chemotaxis protein MotB